MSEPPPPSTGHDAAPVSELSYSEASRELDEIVAFFEHRDVDVDLLVARLERATAIVDELDRRIRRTRMQVEELVPRLEAATRAPSVEPADEGSSEDDDLGWEPDDDDEEDVAYDELEAGDIDVADADSDRPLF